MFRQLIDREPSLLVLDDLDLLVSAPQNDQDETLNGEAWYYRRLAFHIKLIPHVYLVTTVSTFFLNFRISALIIELVKSTPFLNQVMIIATAINGKSLHPRLYNYESSHLFTCELIIPPLTNVSVM
jgi:hypothetical protein